MAGYIGKIEPFDEGQESWTNYQERLEEYFTVNEIAEDKKVSALLTLLGGKTYSLLRNLTSPDKPSTKGYADLVKLLKDHLSPKPLVIAERFRFHKRNQREGETLTHYIAELRKLAEFCKFGANLNDSLRDRLVSVFKLSSKSVTLSLFPQKSRISATTRPQQTNLPFCWQRSRRKINIK